MTEWVYCTAIQEGDEEAEDRPFYSDSDADSSTDSESDTPDASGDEAARPRSRGPMDADHRLLLTSVKPLLLSRNSGVCTKDCAWVLLVLMYRSI